MRVATRTPEGTPNACLICGTSVVIAPSHPPGDAPCPACGCLLWFPQHRERARERLRVAQDHFALTLAILGQLRRSTKAKACIVLDEQGQPLITVASQPASTDGFANLSSVVVEAVTLLRRMEPLLQPGFSTLFPGEGADTIVLNLVDEQRLLATVIAADDLEGAARIRTVAAVGVLRGLLAAAPP